jgi:hypothetical protein
VLEVGDKLGYVHIGENHRGYLRSGHLPGTSTARPGTLTARPVTLTARPA